MKIYAGFIGEQLEERVKNDPELSAKPITIFYDYAVQDINQLKENPYNILFINEPNEYFGLHDWALQNGQYFNIILTWNEEILKRYPENSLLFPFAPGNPNWSDEYKENKNFEVSFLCGSKNLVEGHHLRHRIYSLEDTIQIPKHFIYTSPWDGGKDRCWKSMYHIAIENVKHNNWFTEKLMDCFLSKTIPLYWGTSNIDTYFNTNGIIKFNNELELIDIINNLTPEYYESKRKYIEENYIRALPYADFVGRINEIIKEICKINKI